MTGGLMGGMTGWQIFFAPWVPMGLLWVLAGCGLVVLGVALWRGLTGWTLRGLALASILMALAGPSVQLETRDPLPDMLLALVDDSASQSLGPRLEQSQQALRWLREAATQAGAELVLRRVGDDAEGRGTLMAADLDAALAEIPADQLAGVIVISDGAVEDADQLTARAATLPAPAHVLLSGARRAWDRRLMVAEAPRFAVTGEEITLRLRVEALGPAPDLPAEILLSIDGAAPSRHQVTAGRDLALPLTLDHGGETLVHLALTPLAGELTTRNNQAAIRINGIRDRLRVLLVTGVPHPGTRTWRNLLKSDASVDLVHFTILRPPNKQDGVPVNELSLIPFPTQDLFIEKIDEFDLIIFDRYQLRGILPGIYLESVRHYVEDGGAVLVAAGPEFSGAESLSRSPLGDVLPARPTGRVVEGAVQPELSDIGLRHPVTQALDDADNWGPWLRHQELDVTGGQVVMQSPEGAALLALDRVGDGRVALLGSDQVWLWARGYDGGGPQLELLRRLAHWMMGEPELEEEALRATAQDGQVVITRQTLAPKVEDLMVAAPDGGQFPLEMQPDGPGRFSATLPKGPAGVYRFSQEDQSVVAVLGEAAPLEFAAPLADLVPLTPFVTETGGQVWRVEDGMPRLRPVRVDQVAAGRGWIGYTPRGAYISRDLRVAPALPRWAWLLIAAGGMLAAWLWEGRARTAQRAGNDSTNI